MGITVKLQMRSVEKTKWQKFAQGVKDLGPLFTSLAAIIVTITIAYSTYEYNARQAAITQGDLKRSWLADFTDNDDAKRKIGAIKLAAYGDEALPAIKDALGVTNEFITKGGILTALTIYRSQPKNRPHLLDSMLGNFEDTNPTLRLGVLEFYIEASKELNNEERNAFLQHLKNRLGPNAKNCGDEDEEFVLNAARFLGMNSFAEAKGLLLDIVRNCPSGENDGKYEGARNQAVNLLPSLIDKQHSPKTERDAIINSLQELAVNGPEELKGNVKAAIDRIQKIQGP